ncbi:uncharacterized protein TRAVEDRAFT_24944 [Trametes versicolor FP-101664 SS1]|uniref:Uncharacterized protein n=1 Tax=Trametes versicolor (strain FP-101664) TaxID=717944 RepID=R7S6L9_TRAVS|nr:uncharacterized protein TRAVEDRAFT_24944 [Trametes versicolor FP-101664 SS1]EIW51588.1 hypothetical protein TRAVEDRAFT_24944 [Trametes versicolor FP-101664 SS1]
MQAPFIRFVPGDKPPRAECIENGCTIKNVAQACGHKRCKRHCLLQAAPCGQSGHDVARRAGTLTAIPQPLDPSNLAHPPPVIPLLPVAAISLTPPSTNPSNTAVSEDMAAGSQDPPSRNFRIPMPSSFQADWDARTQAQNTKRQAEEERRKHLALLKQEYTVNIWVQNGQAPNVHNRQGSPTWPTVTLASLTDIVGPLGLTPSTAIERYHIPSRTWRREQVQTVIKATNQDNLLFRLVGVTDCRGLDQFCILAGQRTQLTTTSLMSLVSATSAMSITPADNTPTTLIPTTSAMSITPADSIPAVLAPPYEHPITTQSSPSPSPPPFLEPPPPPSFPATQAAVLYTANLPSEHAATDSAPGPDDLDYLWLTGTVYTPPLDKKAWPAGIYARDMAQAFSMLGNTGDDTGLKERFEYVFRGRPFKSATYHAQRFAWIHSTQEQREWVMGLPRTKEGLWTNCRRKLTGWKQLPAHQ